MVEGAYSGCWAQLECGRRGHIPYTVPKEWPERGRYPVERTAIQQRVFRKTGQGKASALGVGVSG